MYHNLTKVLGTLPQDTVCHCFHFFKEIKKKRSEFGIYTTSCFYSSSHSLYSHEVFCFSEGLLWSRIHNKELEVCNAGGTREREGEGEAQLGSGTVSLFPYSAHLNEIHTLAHTTFPEDCCMQFLKCGQLVIRHETRMTSRRCRQRYWRNLNTIHSSVCRKCILVLAFKKCRLARSSECMQSEIQSGP